MRFRRRPGAGRIGPVGPKIPSRAATTTALAAATLLAACSSGSSSTSSGSGTTAGSTAGAAAETTIGVDLTYNCTAFWAAYQLRGRVPRPAGLGRTIVGVGKVYMVVRASNTIYGLDACAAISARVKSGYVLDLEGDLTSSNGATGPAPPTSAWPRGSSTRRASPAAGAPAADGQLRGRQQPRRPDRSPVS